MPQLENYEMHFSKEFTSVIELFRNKIEENIEAKTETFTDILIDFYEKKFRPHLPANGRDFRLDSSALKSLIRSFWADIIRLQAYHDIADPDRHKYSAFLFKWVSKGRPIKLADGCDHLVKCEGVYAQSNAHFAFHCALQFLKCGRPNNTEYESIIYSACYRDIHPEQWSILFYFMEKANNTIVDIHKMILIILASNQNGVAPEEICQVINQYEDLSLTVKIVLDHLQKLEEQQKVRKLRGSSKWLRIS